MSPASAVISPLAVPATVRASGLSTDVSSPTLAAGRPTEAPLLAIGLVVAAMASFSVSDTISKGLTGAIPPLEIAWLRWTGFVLFMLPVLARSRGRILVAHAPVSQILRALGLLGSSYFFIVALGALPMATATAIGFVSPLFVTLLSIPILGEDVRLRRWAAIVVGLVGVLVVVQPGGARFETAALFPLLSALCWAIGVIFTRKASGIDGTMTAMTYTALVGFVVLSALVPTVWVTPDVRQTGLSLLMAACALGGQLLIVLAYARAPASLLAPFSYSQIVWATTLGFLVFGNWPAASTWIGAAIIIASGIYTAHRERVRAREARAEARARAAS